MGNCWAKSTNEVAPAPTNLDIAAILSSSSLQVVGAENSTDFHQKLKREAELERQLRECGVEPKLAVGALGFDIMVADGIKPPPGRLVQQNEHKAEKKAQLKAEADTSQEYSLEDKHMIADILRTDKLVEKTQLARRREERTASARCRREASLEARKERVEGRSSAVDVERCRDVSKEYSLEDKHMIAEILRTDKLAEKTQLARSREERIASARCRRDTSMEERKERVENKPSAGDVERRRENLRKLAVATKAAAKKDRDKKGTACERE